MTSVSIIIPAWNEERTLKVTLEALLQIDYDRSRCEVIVVAGGDDDTYEMAQGLSTMAREFSRYAVIRQRPHGKNAAIQRGIKEARNEIIVLLDADTMVTKEWLRNMVHPIEQGNCDLTTANPEPVRKNWVSDYYMTIKAYSLDSVTMWAGHSIALRASIVRDRLEYFFDKDVKVGVDYLLQKRFLEEGRKMLFVKHARVITHSASSLKYFVLGELRWLTARINIDGVRYRDFAANAVVIGALISAIPLSKTLFTLSMLFNAIYISKKIRIFLIGSRHYNTSPRNLFGFVFISYVFHIVGFIAYVKWFLGLSRTSYLRQGQRY